MAKDEPIRTAFWNVQNLFDMIASEIVADMEFTPDGGWTPAVLDRARTSGLRTSTPRVRSTSSSSGVGCVVGAAGIRLSPESVVIHEDQRTATPSGRLREFLGSETGKLTWDCLTR